MAGGEGGREGGGDCCGAVGVGFPSPPCRNGLAIMGKLKPGIQPSTSLLVCKRACCLRWRVESPVCHIHDVFPRDTQHTAPWQHDIYIYTCTVANILPSPSLRPASSLAPSAPLLSHVSVFPFRRSRSPRLLSRTGLGTVKRRSGACPTSPLRRDTLNTSTAHRAGLRTLPSLSTLDNSKLIPPNWLAGVDPPRGSYARDYTRVFLESWITLIRYTRLEYQPPGDTWEDTALRIFCPFRFGK